MKLTKWKFWMMCTVHMEQPHFCCHCCCCEHVTTIMCRHSTVFSSFWFPWTETMCSLYTGCCVHAIHIHTNAIISNCFFSFSFLPYLATYYPFQLCVYCSVNAIVWGLQYIYIYISICNSPVNIERFVDSSMWEQGEIVLALCCLFVSFPLSLTSFHHFKQFFSFRIQLCFLFPSNKQKLHECLCNKLNK